MYLMRLFGDKRYVCHIALQLFSLLIGACRTETEPNEEYEAKNAQCRRPARLYHCDGDAYEDTEKCRRLNRPNLIVLEDRRIHQLYFKGLWHGYHYGCFRKRRR